MNTHDEETLTTYKNAIHTYTPEELHWKPSSDEWSLAQVYDHTLVVAHEYLEEADACYSEANAEGDKTPFGEELFARGGFPPIKIRLPDEMNQPPSNVDSAEQLMTRLVALHERMTLLSARLDERHREGKRRHGGFGWLTANEWFQLVGMHFRHHERQLAELDERVRRKRNGNNKSI